MHLTMSSTPAAEMEFFPQSTSILANSITASRILLVGAIGVTQACINLGLLALVHPFSRLCQVSNGFTTRSRYIELILIDESGWAWLIPLRGGKTSVGIVMNQEISNQKKAQMPSELKSLRGHYLEELSSRAPAIKELLAQGTLIEDEGTVVRSASDYSYHATSYAGLNYRIVGDAGGIADITFAYN